MMGAGKTSLGRHISDLTGREHLDIDQMIVQRLGRPIPQLFKLYGETAFREHEANVLRSIESQRAVVSTGGGIVMREDNWQEMKRLGLVIYVKVSYQNLIHRLELSKKKRPLLDFEDWRERLRQLLEQRTPYYERADLIIDITGLSVDEAAELIIERVECQA